MTPRTITKRDGSTQRFEPTKITTAIRKAAEATQHAQPHQFAIAITGRVLEHIPDTVAVEEVQDFIEQELMRAHEYDTARAFILYREQHKQLRQTPDLENNLETMRDYLQLEDWEVKENANMTYSLQGLNNHIASKLSKQYWLNKIYPKELAQAHSNADIHIHDLGQLSTYCVGWDLQDLLLKGFTGVPGKISSKPAKHFRVALMQIVNFFYTLQGESAGAQAFSSLDTLLAPFIAYDNLNRKQVKQALQEFVFNLNVPTRVGFQTPFTNITLDLTVPSTFAHEPVIIGGETKQRTYKEFQAEMDLFNQTLAEVLSEGDAQGRVLTFPIPTYNITETFDWDNPAYAAIWEMTAKYGIPYFANFVNSDMDPEDVRSMCCRLRLDNRELRKRGGGLFGANPLTGSIGVVTINLPRIGYTSETKEEIFAQLDVCMEHAKTSLEIKRKTIERFTEQGLFPYSKFYLESVYDATRGYWTNHFSTIGIVGMNELLLNFNNTALEDDQELALEIMEYMRERLAEYQEETGNIYNLEATPAEGTAYRLARIDRMHYPDIQCANTTGEPYYTNSTQLNVEATPDLFAALTHQDPLQTKYTGGTVFHAFLGEDQLPAETVKRLVRSIAHQFSLPYYTITPTFSICEEHGRMAGEHHTCPKCGKPCEVYSRVVGYLRPVGQWNEGKQQEFRNRTTYEKSVNV